MMIIITTTTAATAQHTIHNMYNKQLSEKSPSTFSMTSCYEPNYFARFFFVRSFLFFLFTFTLSNGPQEYLKQLILVGAHFSRCVYMDLIFSNNITHFHFGPFRSSFDLITSHSN